MAIPETAARSQQIHNRVAAPSYQNWKGVMTAPPPPLPKEAHTPWRTRLLAFLIDWTPVWLVFVVPMLGVLIVDGADCYDNIYGSGNGYCSTAQANSWLLVQVIGFLPAAVYFFWNFGYRQGKTGSSIGKSVLKFKVVSERTWQPIGFWPSIGHQIATTSTNSSVDRAAASAGAATASVLGRSLLLARVGHGIDDTATVDRWAEQHGRRAIRGVVGEERLAAPAPGLGLEVEIVPVDTDHDHAVGLHIGHRHR
jgi:uncharacterized RDD family membrane protein YckC